MGTMVLQMPLFRSIFQRQFSYPASATAAATTTATTITATTRRRRRERPPSTAPESLSSLADFLVESVDFSKQEALSTSTKLVQSRRPQLISKVCAPSFYRNADLVISFLEQKGLKKPQIRKLISFTRILSCKIEKTLEPKMNCFLELGFSISDFADMITTHPGILGYGLDSAIRPAVEALRTIMGSNENVVRFIKGLRLNGFRPINKRVVPNVSLLQARGVPIESIRRRLLQQPRPFMRKPEVFKDLVAQAEAKWGVSPSSPTFLSAVQVLCCRNIESKCRMFESFGWDRSDLVALFRRNPTCFGLSERTIEAKLRFFMNELGYDIGFIIKNSPLFTCSLEKRVLPRHLVLRHLKDKGLLGENLSLHVALTMVESQFLNRYIRPFEDLVPDLHDIYVSSLGSSAQGRIK